MDQNNLDSLAKSFAQQYYESFQKNRPAIRCLYVSMELFSYESDFINMYVK